MPIQNISPTRSNLIQTRQTLELAREGHDILDQKREVLTGELVQRAHDAVALQETVWERLRAAYRALDRARLSMGREHLEWTALAVNTTIEVDITMYSVMGVVLPTVEAHGSPPEMPYGPGDTTVSLDEAVAQFNAVLDAVPALAQKVTSIWRLAHELQKTQRRVNALEHIFIPTYEDTVGYIESTLEEREREETFRLKRLKGRGTRAK